MGVEGRVQRHRHVGAGWRLLGHFLAAAGALLWLGGYAVLPSALAAALGLPGWLIGVVSVLYLVWLLNLYNFMDGIDGIAAVEALSVCLGMALIYALGGQGDLLPAPLLLPLV